MSCYGVILHYVCRQVAVKFPVDLEDTRKENYTESVAAVTTRFKERKRILLQFSITMSSMCFIMIAVHFTHFMMVGPTWIIRPESSGWKEIPSLSREQQGMFWIPFVAWCHNIIYERKKIAWNKEYFNLREICGYLFQC